MESAVRQGVVRLLDGPARHRLLRALIWSGLVVSVWIAKGLPFDLLRLTPLIPLPVDTRGMAVRTVALAAAVVLARLALARPAGHGAARPATWYGYAAFVLALPYPLLRTWWALGGTAGLLRPGGAGSGFAPLLLAIPWLAAAALSLLLVSPPRWLPRRLLLVAGWSATAIVGLIGLAACAALISPPVSSRAPEVGIAMWVFYLFYGSWLLFAIAAGAATRSYQLRSGAR